jgi:hypothetical protein
MTYYFSDGYKIAGVSMVTGLITSSVLKTYSAGAFAYDMMRSTENCFGATRARYNISAGVDPIAISTLEGSLFPNPSSSQITVSINAPLSKIEIVDVRGNILFETREKTIDISSLPSGIYFSKVMTENGQLFTSKFIKN